MQGWGDWLPGVASEPSPPQMVKTDSGPFIAAEIKTDEKMVILSSHQMVAKHFSGHEQQEYHK